MNVSSLKLMRLSSTVHLRSVLALTASWLTRFKRNVQSMKLPFSLDLSVSPVMSVSVNMSASLWQFHQSCQFYQTFPFILMYSCKRVLFWRILCWFKSVCSSNIVQICVSNCQIRLNRKKTGWISIFIHVKGLNAEIDSYSSFFGHKMNKDKTPSHYTDIWYSYIIFSYFQT